MGCEPERCAQTGRSCAPGALLSHGVCEGESYGQFSPEMKAERLTMQNRTGGAFAKLELPSELWTGYVQTVPGQKNKFLPLLSQLF